MLEQLRQDADWQAEPVFFYLDAHWLTTCRCSTSCTSVRHGWSDFAALIDDFRVDGDDGYYYDDYGDGKTLALPLLAAVQELADLHVFWPAAAHGRKAGARRGWVVLASPGVGAEALAVMPELRGGGPLGDQSAAA